MAEAGTGTNTPSDEPPSGESGSGTADSESSPDSGNSTNSGNSTASEHSTRKLKNKDEIKQALYDQYFFRRLWWTCVGIVLIGLGSAVLRVGQVGVDPYTAANIGISNTIGISLGSYQLISNFVLFIPMILWGRQYIGVGTVINMVMVGYLVQWFFQLLDPISWDHPTGAEKTLLFCCGILIFDYGCSLYMTSHLGNSPYDAVAPIIVDHTGAKYRVVRVIQAYSSIRNTAGSIGVVAASIVERDDDGKIKVTEADGGDIGEASVGGSLIGMLIGILGGPLGMLLGFGLGALGGALVDADHADDADDAVTEFSRLVPPGHTQRDPGPDRGSRHHRTRRLRAEARRFHQPSPARRCPLGGGGQPGRRR
ncbi:hypothetical protein GCM10027169_20230 [Gordonia jinhuaensis]|uniref:Uncharacterized protein n=1 Tax=Gordonia jinhuaensis TaxID=1517702 RepID=A0A916THA3_9ACTN|nr:hypothetical protein [Gordonia jinhuaensis]GGB44059.1 hypothetical protein GCM10011489_34510 [Gordonia jinhuaensis]